MYISRIDAPENANRLSEQKFLQVMIDVGNFIENLRFNNLGFNNLGFNLRFICNIMNKRYRFILTNL